jgi:hypothetical protein
MRAAVLGLVVTMLGGLGYVVAQQVVRHAADHPQMEMARTAVSRLDAGASPYSMLPKTAVDLGRSQNEDPYVIVVGTDGQVLASSVTLGGVAIVPPSGVFDFVRSHGEDTISWQPAPGVRSAIVVDAFDAGFVVAGRSLKSTEDLESSLLWWAAAAWAVAMVAVGLVTFRRRAE